MDKNKRITVVIPVYNAEKYIGRCLDSIINQTVNNYKILLINDGSKDNSQKIIEWYKAKYPEIIEYIYQENRKKYFIWEEKGINEAKKLMKKYNIIQND